MAKGKSKGDTTVTVEDEAPAPPKAPEPAPAAADDRKARMAEHGRRQRTARTLQVAAGRYRVAPFTEGNREAVDEAYKAL